MRPDPEAAQREAEVQDEAADSPDGPDQAQAVQDFLRGRQVARLVGTLPLRVVSVHDPALQRLLDDEPAVRALLDSADGRRLLAPGSQKAHLDEEPVRLSSPFGRDLSKACSLALRDQDVRPYALHYRSRHDDAEDCWALYDHADVEVVEVVPLQPDDDEHRAAVKDVAVLWGLALPSSWT